MKPPGWRFNRRNRQSTMARQEAQVPGRVAGASNQRSVTVRRNYGDFSTQLPCKRCQIAAVSHSRDGYSVIAKSLIPNSYSAYYPRTASISGGPCGSRGGPAAYMPWTQAWRCGLGAAHRVVLSVASRPPLFPSFFGFLVLVTTNLYDSL
jgi:hypothetical protein